MPIAVHLDHATTDEDIDTSLRFAEAGVAFDSIMVDASHADTDEENLAIVRVALSALPSQLPFLDCCARQLADLLFLPSHSRRSTSPEQPRSELPSRSSLVDSRVARPDSESSRTPSSPTPTRPRCS